MTNSYLNSLGALFSATGPMAPTVNRDLNFPLHIAGFRETSHIEIPGIQLIVWPSGFAFSTTARSGNTSARLDFKYTISGDDTPTAPSRSPR